MQFLELVRGIFTLANSFIALFIVIYAFMFLKKTKSHKERRPWDYLFVASIIYLGYTLLTTLITYNVGDIGSVDLEALNVFFQFLYTGLILLAFISQTDLIFRNEIIIITRKLEPGQKGKLEEKVELEVKEEEKFINREKLVEKEEEKQEENAEKKQRGKEQHDKKKAK